MAAMQQHRQLSGPQKRSPAAGAPHCSVLFSCRWSTRAGSAARQQVPHRRPVRDSCSAAGRGDEQPDLVLAGEQCPVPRDQQPMYELKSLQEAFLFDWATLPVPKFALRLLLVYVGFLVAVGLPVSAASFSPSHEPLQCLLAASVGSLLITTVLVFRLYTGWSHVGNRLLSATVEYEETGWYDGQVWVKSPQMLMRDRLLGAYSVRPTLDRLKRAMLAMGGALAASFILLALLPPAQVNMGDDSSTDDGSTRSVRAAAGMLSDEEYWQRVQQYEPWALEDEESNAGEEEAAGATAGSILDHMHSSFPP